MDYPIWGITIGGGVLMALVAVTHVIVSHFAIGGGLVIAVTETLAVRRGDEEFRELARRGSLALILISTVFGAISGVGIWVVAGLISPGAISSLIHNYVWGWAIEWAFFIVEIVAALVYYTTWGKISKGAHLLVGWVYFIAAYFSLVVINGIIAFMLTPGKWLETGSFWDGFFNPTYWPALALRTGICAMMATAFLIFVARKGKASEQTRLARYLAMWLIGGGLVSYAGYRWWESALPETVLGVFRGDSPLLSSLASTRSLTLWALAAALAFGLLLLATLPRTARTTVAVLAALAAFTFFGSYERLREGVRKPFLIHSRMFSNGLAVEDIARINEQGMAASSGWVALADDDLSLGRNIFKAQCSICHTMDGYQAIRPLLPTTADFLALGSGDPPGSGRQAFQTECASCHADFTYEDMVEMVPGPDEIREDPEFVQDLTAMMILSTLEKLRDMGSYYAMADPAVMVDTHQTEFPLMPPVVGNDSDLEALALYLGSLENPMQGGER